jgi:hypothetical protein
MTMRIFSLLGAIAVILWVTSPPAGAVSVVVTSGFLEDSNNFDVWFDLRSATHTISCNPQFCGDFNVFPGGQAYPTGSIQTVQAQATVTGHPGPVTVNGVAFPLPAGGGTIGRFDFSVGPFTVPTFTPGTFPSGMAEAPFTFVGNLNAVNPQGNVLDLTLTGQGQSRVFFDLSPRTAGFITSMSFSFTDATGGGPVIPEPSTVLLLASGLAGVGLWRRGANKQPVA